MKKPAHNGLAVYLTEILAISYRDDSAWWATSREINP
jgi:hypothetical protein